MSGDGKRCPLCGSVDFPRIGLISEELCTDFWHVSHTDPSGNSTMTRLKAEVEFNRAKDSYQPVSDSSLMHGDLRNILATLAARQASQPSSSYHEFDASFDPQPSHASGELGQDNYVAWLRFTENGPIQTCDSDAPGAFKVYRWPSEPRADHRAYFHKAIERVQEMRKLDLERAREPNAVDCDYYLGRAHRCDDILFWLGELESQLPAGDEFQRGQQAMAEKAAQQRECVIEWRALADDFNVTRGDSEVEAAYHRCADELERSLAGADLTSQRDINVPLEPPQGKLARYEAALRKMISQETDWYDGEIGVGHLFRKIARDALASREPGASERA